MTVEMMRDYITNHSKYSGSKKWADKVKNMPNGQIIALYNSLLNRKALGGN